MMAATVLWLLRLAGPERRGRAMGHIGLANYAGLTIGPPLSEALSGRSHPARVWIPAAVLPLIAAAFAAALGRSPDRESRPTRSTGKATSSNPRISEARCAPRSTPGSV